MPAPVAITQAPYTVPAGETDLDTVTGTGAIVQLDITIRVSGTPAQVKADWATLLGTSLSAPSSIMWNHEI